jgi:hypothetical protein
MDKVNEESCATIGFDPQDIYPGECADDSIDMEIIKKEKENINLLPEKNADNNNNNDNQDSKEASIPTPLPVYAIIVVTTVFMCEGFAVCYFFAEKYLLLLQRFNKR